MNNESIALARRYGAIISLLSALGAALFVIGLARRSYVAIVVPVSALVLGGLSAAFVLGRLLMTTPDIPEEF